MMDRVNNAIAVSFGIMTGPTLGYEEEVQPSAVASVEGIAAQSASDNTPTA
jgi:hypothetical protein